MARDVDTSDLHMPVWPHFTHKQVAFLEGMFPARCIEPREQIEDHLRYAGMVDLISQMRDHVPDAPGPHAVAFDDDSSLDEEAIRLIEAGIGQD